MIVVYKQLKLLFSLVLFILLVSSSFAQDRKAQKGLQDTVFTLSSVTVTASKIKKEIIPVQVLDGKDLEKLSVYSVADAIRYFSGVQVKDYGGIGGLKTVNVRSMGSHHVGIFYDGLELGNAQNGVVDLGRFSLDNVESISMYNGQKSSIFQSAKDYASASSIYIVASKPKFKAKKHNLNIGLKGGSFKTINPSILWEQKLSDKLSGSLSSEFLYTSGEYKFSYSKKEAYDTTELRKNGDVRMFRAEAALFGKISGGEWKAKAYFYNSERGYPGASVREEPGKFKHQDRQWDNNFFVQGTVNKDFVKWYSLMLNAKYAYDYLHYLSDPRVDVSTMYVNNRYKQHESYLSVSNLFVINRWWTSSLSNDLQFNTLDADLVDFVYPKRFSLYSALASSIDFKRFKMQASLLHTFIKERTRIEGAQAEAKSVFTPSFLVSWQVFNSPSFNLRAFYKRVFRMPTFNDLYYTFIGNKDLKPEYTTQYNLGFTYSKHYDRKVFNALEFQVDAYFNQIEDKIIAMPTSNQFRWTMLNLGYVEIRGVDMSVQCSINIAEFNVSPRLSYTYQKAQDFTDKKSDWYGGQIPYIPWHSGSVILATSYKKWSFNYSYIYTGRRYEAVANIRENEAQPWYTHDISFSKIFELSKLEIRATAEVNNLLNQQYEVVQCYPMPGTNFKLKINIIL